MILQHPYWLVLWALLPAGVFLLRKRTYVGTSSVNLLAPISGSRVIAALPWTVFLLGLATLIFALSGPQRTRKYTERTIRARDIIVGVDVSHSMQDPWNDPIPPVVLEPNANSDFSPEGNVSDKSKPSVELPFRKPEDVRKATAGARRIDAAQSCVVRFVLNRARANAGDRIGVIAFDLDPWLSWPLTHDLKQIYRKGAFLSEEPLNGGTNFGETGPGPMDLAATHFHEFGKAHTRVLILMTDGEAEMSNETKERLAKLLRQSGIRLYLIALGPQLLDPTHHTEIGDFTENWVHGTIFRANNSADLERCFNSIDQMERSEIQVQTRQEAEPMFMYFVAAGLALVFVFTISRMMIVEV